MESYNVTVKFVEPVLGAVALDPGVYSENAGGANAPSAEAWEEELATLPEQAQAGLTGFMRDEEGRPIEYDYVWRGFFKDACSMLRRVKGTESSRLTAYKKVIDGLVFISPRRIPYILPAGVDPAQLEVLHRPLRASTAQGERVALAHSEMVPAGTTMSFKVKVLDVVDEPLLREWLDYGQLRGFRQWRNGGYGRFEYELVREK